MLLVGVTGGIGSGKSTFAALLAERGAHVIDADQLGRDAVKPGRPTWHSVVDQFGDEVITPLAMEIDRGRLAEIVFADPEKLAALNAIVHPPIFKAIADELDILSGTDTIVVVDAALIFETGLDKAMNVVVAVVSTRATRRARLMRHRAMTADQANARMATQIDPDDSAARADIVVRNDRTLEDLAVEADRVWKELEDRRRG